MQTLIAPYEPASIVRSVPPDTAALTEAFERFLDLDVAGGRASADTIRTYFVGVKRFCAWLHFQNIAPGTVTAHQVKLYRAHLRDKGFSKATVALYITAVRQFYNAAVENGLLAVNPAANVKGGSDNTPRDEKIKALTEGSLMALLGGIDGSTLAGKRNRAVVALMALHGLRRVEAHRLDHESFSDDGDTAKIVVNGKGDKNRSIYLRPDTLRVWAEYEQAKADAGYPIEGPFFIALDNGNAGNRLSRQSFNAIVDKYLNGADLKRDGVSCHALRHTYGTLAVSGGAKVEHLRDAMGHSSVATSSLYVQAVEKRKNNPANFIGAEVKFGV